MNKAQGKEMHWVDKEEPWWKPFPNPASAEQGQGQGLYAHTAQEASSKRKSKHLGT